LPQSEALIGTIEKADLFFFSLISLAILPAEGRAKLFEIARAVRARGGRVAFDSNYRPRLWKNANEAIAARDEALSCCDIGLPTLEDESMLAQLNDSEAVAKYWQARGVKEVIVKLGAQGCRIDNGQIVAPPRLIQPVDTSGAGDAFNAGYLNARLNNMSIEESALAGHRLAGWVVTQPGAIPKPTADAPY
jgi:2-dehydro-3-deoxygluconokinase